MAQKRHARGISRAASIEAWIVLCTIALSVWLYKSGLLSEFMLKISELGPLPASLVAGAAYSTFITTPLAIGGFVAMSGTDTIPVWQIAIAGALGATVIDLMLVKGARSPLAMMIVHAIVGRDSEQFKTKVKKWPAFKWLAASIGGFLVAIPLPTDELGVVFFSASGLRALQMLPLIFAADFVGVYAIVSAGQFFTG